MKAKDYSKDFIKDKQVFVDFSYQYDGTRAKEERQGYAKGLGSAKGLKFTTKALMMFEKVAAFVLAGSIIGFSVKVNSNTFKKRTDDINDNKNYEFFIDNTQDPGEIDFSTTDFYLVYDRGLSEKIAQKVKKEMDNYGASIKTLSIDEVELLKDNFEAGDNNEKAIIYLKEGTRNRIAVNPEAEQFRSADQHLALALNNQIKRKSIERGLAFNMSYTSPQDMDETRFRNAIFEDTSILKDDTNVTGISVSPVVLEFNSNQLNANPEFSNDKIKGLAKNISNGLINHLMGDKDQRYEKIIDSVDTLGIRFKEDKLGEELEDYVEILDVKKGSRKR